MSNIERRETPGAIKSSRVEFKTVRQPRVEIVWTLAFGSLLFGLYTHATWIYFGLAIVALSGIALLASKKQQMRGVDFVVLLICAFELFSFCVSQYHSNSIYQAWTVCMAALAYLVVRLVVRTPTLIVCLSGLLGVGGACLGLSGMIRFNENVRLLTESGLSNLLAFRSQLFSPPSPWISGEWFTLLLIALSLACVLPVSLWQRHKNWPAALSSLFPTLICSTLLLSLSRAVFLSTVLFFMGFTAFLAWRRLFTFRKAATLSFSLLAVLTLIPAVESILFPGVFSAYTSQHVSQVRSTEGRLTIWHRSLEIVREHPFWGVGASNSALALMASADQDDTTGFASRTFSLPLQVLVEKGLLGFLLYLTFLTLVAREFIVATRCSPPKCASVSTSNSKLEARNSASTTKAVLSDDSARKAVSCCFAAGLVAVLTRELVYSSLLEHTLTLVLVAILCALTVRQDQA